MTNMQLNVIASLPRQAKQSEEILTDEALYELCKIYGERARLWRQKFTGLLPEVFKRELYKKKGFGSIFEFAFKLAGLSEQQVRRVLNLEKKFEDLPNLHEMLVNGEVSVNKLARVASIATQENEEAIANQVKLLPQSALETLVRDEKSVRAHNLQDIGAPLSLRAKRSNLVSSFQRTWESISAKLNLSEEVQQKLLELQQKGIDINSLILQFLEKREEGIAETKERISAAIQPAKSGYIPIETQRLLQEEHGKKCSITTCHKPSEETHHTQRFSLSQNHDPRFLAPLCRDHHIIAHSIDIKYQEARAGASGKCCGARSNTAF